MQFYYIRELQYDGELIWYLVIAYDGSLMMTQNWVRIGSGNGLVPDGTKPLLETILINFHWGSVAVI